MQADVDMVDDRRCAASGSEIWALCVEYAAFHKERAPTGSREAHTDDPATYCGERTIFCQNVAQSADIALYEPYSGFKADQAERIIAT